MQIISATEDDLRVLGEKLASYPNPGFDFECTTDSDVPGGALHWDKLSLCGYSFGFPEDGSSTYVPIRHAVGPNAPRGPAMDLVKRVAADKSKVLDIHNVKYELSVFDSIDTPLDCSYRDSMLGVWVLEKGLGGNRGHKLKPLVKEYLKHKMIEWEEVIPQKMLVHEVDSRVVAPYAADDALQAGRLMRWAQPQIDELGMGKVFAELEMPFVRVLRHMENVGIELDSEFLIRYREELELEANQLADEWGAFVGCPIGSNLQISRLLYEDLKWWPKLDFKAGKSGSISVDETHRKQIRTKLRPKSRGLRALDMKDRYACLSKLISTYTTSLVAWTELWDDGRLRTDWKQQGTVTGRLASASPAVMNIPVRTPEGAKIREAFIAPPGWKLAVVDESQFELRIMAHLSQDPMLMKAYNQNIDLHQQTADNCGTSRNAGKVTNLGLMYEMQIGTLASNLGVSQARAAPVHKAWHQMYRQVGRYHARQHALASKNGMVRTITNRIRRINPRGLKLNPGMRAFWERVSSNSPCQGSAADIFKIAMRNLYREWVDRGVLYNPRTGKGDAKMTIQVHDELICEFRDPFAKEGLADVERHLENAVTLRVPLVAEGHLGQNWMLAKNG